MTEQDIERLISCKKVVSKTPPKELKKDGQQLRGEFELESQEDNYSFEVKIRKHIKFIENFSIVLVYRDPEHGAITLLRCNGNHNQTILKSDRQHQHFLFHVHRMTVDYLDNGQKTDPPFWKEVKEYASYEQALFWFFQQCKVMDFTRHFPEIAQLSFWD